MSAALIAAVRTALESLESVLCDPEGRAGIRGTDADNAVIDEAMDALRTALAESKERKPVALQHMATVEAGALRWMTGRKIDSCELYAVPDFGVAQPLYAAPQDAAEPYLLEALNRINDWCCYASEEDTSARLMALQQIGQAARAAIAKAKGTQS